MSNADQLKSCKDFARRVLASHGVRASTGIGYVGDDMGVMVRVPIDEGPYAVEVLSEYGWPVGIEVIETYRPQARAANGRDENFLGGVFGDRSIHPPPDPNPRVLTGDARAFWDSVQQDAYDYYASAGAPKAKSVSEKTAWRAVRMHWEDRNGQWVPRRAKLKRPRKTKVPAPGDLITLGKLLEYAWLDNDGVLNVRKWTDYPPNLYWNHRQKALYSFPHVPEQTVCEPVTEDLAEVAAEYEKWAQRKPTCVHPFEIDAGITIIPSGVGDSVAYRSDKWHIKNSVPYLENSQEYFHQFSDGVWISQDNDTSPHAILMRGGKLDVEERGIIH